jgi:hypothetical protein
LIRKILKILAIILAILVILAVVYVGLLYWGGQDVNYLRRYVSDIHQVEQIDIYYRDRPEWLRCSSCPSPSCIGPCSPVTKVIITDPEVIDRLMAALQNPREYLSMWSNCQYTAKLVFHDYGKTEHTLLVCHEGLFTNSAIHASGVINYDLLSWDYIFNLELTPQSLHDPTPAPTETVNPELLITQPYVTETPNAISAAEPKATTLEPNLDEITRWQEYEKALGNAVFEGVERVEVLCEWRIFARDVDKVYVWTVCTGYHPSDLTDLDLYGLHAVVSLDSDGSVLDVGTVENTAGSSYKEIRQTLFPAEIYQKFKYPVDNQKLNEHLAVRREHPLPPLIVLDSEYTPVETQFAADWMIRSTPMGDGVMTDQVGFHMSELMHNFSGNLHTWVMHDDEGRATIVYAGVYPNDEQQGKLIVVRKGTIWDWMGDHIDIPTRSGRPEIIDAVGKRLIIETEMGDIFYFDVPSGKFANSLTETLATMTPGPTLTPRVTATFPSGDDVTNEMYGSSMWPINKDLEFFIHTSDDEDWFQFYLSSTSDIVISLRNVPAPYSLMWVYNSVIPAEWGKDDNLSMNDKVIQIQDAGAGYFFIRVAALSDAFSASNPYTLRFSTE